MTILPRRVNTAVVCAALSALVAASCVEADLEPREAGAGNALATSSTVVSGEDELDVGEATSTARGNTVAVLEADAGADRVHALIEACASPRATEEVGVSLSFFNVQLPDNDLLGPIEPSEAREPALRTQQLDPGTCTVGWLSFDTRTAGFLVFGSQSSATRWDLGDLD